MLDDYELWAANKVHVHYMEVHCEMQLVLEIRMP